MPCNLNPQHDGAEYYHGYSSGHASECIQIEPDRILFLFDRREPIFDIFCFAGIEAFDGAISAIQAAQEDNDSH